jgi:hypothetical protein
VKGDDDAEPTPKGSGAEPHLRLRREKRLRLFESLENLVALASKAKAGDSDGDKTNGGIRIKMASEKARETKDDREAGADDSYPAVEE